MLYSVFLQFKFLLQINTTRRTEVALNKKQQTKIDELISNNKKKSDIIDELVGHHSAKARDVLEYLGENKTLQGIMNSITRRTKDVEGAADLTTRKAAAKEIKDLSKKVIRILQQKSED
jgi:ribosomal protein L22